MDYMQKLSRLLDPESSFQDKTIAAISIHDEMERLDKVILDYQERADRDAARALAKSLVPDVQGPSVAIHLDDTMLAEITEALVKVGRPIHAIKLRRSARNEGLREAKDYVDRFRRAQGIIS